MNRIRRISDEILVKHPDLFTDDFEKNKQLLSSVAVIKYKGLRNEIAGYITAIIRDLASDGEEKEGQTLEQAIAQPVDDLP